MSETNKYTLKVKQYAGEMVLEYNANGVLCKFEQDLPFTHSQLAFLMKLVVNEQRLNDASTQKEFGLKPTALNKVVTFDMFYEKYPTKRDRKKAEAIWNKMKEVEQIRAFNYIFRYIKTLPPGTEAKYPKTYLNSECWHD